MRLTTASVSWRTGMAAPASRVAANLSGTAGRREVLRLSLLEHDLFRKPVPTFRDHALDRQASIISGAALHSAATTGQHPVLPFSRTPATIFSTFDAETKRAMYQRWSHSTTT
jgi:hypothetical protein